MADPGPRSRGSSAPSPSARARPCEKTPTSWRLTPAGLESGPSRLKIVRVPSSTRHGRDMVHRGMMRRREHEADAGLARCSARSLAGSSSTLTPSAISTSAAPDLRGERPVAMLGDRHAAGGGDDRGQRRDIVGARGIAAGADDVDGVGRRLDPQHLAAHGPTAPVISSTVSPRTRSAIRKAADLGIGVASPDSMVSKASRASSRDRDAPVATLAMKGLKSSMGTRSGWLRSGRGSVPRDHRSARSRKLLQDRRAMLRGDALGVELHAMHRQGLVRAAP